jgi:hypothetical protein
VKRSEKDKKEAKTAIIFTSKHNEAKQKRNVFRIDAKKGFFACFHILSKTKMK